ncbi:MAG TPA: glycosyltransferase [Nocardioidaceae bacterium]|nr:glycosyltransferase [Nocardioidaceae bacterium]
MTANAPAPLFSVVTPVYDPPIEVLTATIESVRAQTFPDWELVLVDDCSPNDEVREVLRRFAALDHRISVIERAENGHIVAASNDGLAKARGTFIALLDHDDLLTPHALERNARAIARHEDVDYLYSDEDNIGANGKVTSTFRKPDWSPERLRGQNYCCHLSVLRADLVREVGGFREGLEGSQDHDLILRVTERARRVVHIPDVLYHWRAVPGSVALDRNAKPYAFEAGRRAVQDQLDRLGIGGTVSINQHNWYTIQRQLPAERRVSIIIPTRGSSSVVWGRRRVHVVECVRSALAHTRHENLEIVVVYDGPTPPRVLQELREIVGDRLVLVPFREKFNYSRKVNIGALASSGDRLVLLNDDIEVRSEDWLETLVAPLEEPEVGLTGAKLFFSSTAVQHAGLAFSGGGYYHPFRLAAADDPGPFGALVLNREVSGVTAACLGVRRETFLSAGGFTEHLPQNYNDVDFNLKVRHLGNRVLFVAECQLFHFESQTRNAPVAREEAFFIHGRWGVPRRDPYTPVFPMPERKPHGMRRRGTKSRIG